MSDRLFDSWRPAAPCWQPYGDADLHLPVNDDSLPLVIGMGNAEVFCLGRFESTSTKGAPNLETRQTDAPQDVLLHTGGSIWALDWCPSVDSLKQPPNPASTTVRTTNENPETALSPRPLYLAVGCHPAGAAMHAIGRPLSNPNCVQIWEIPNVEGHEDGTLKPLPKMVLAIAHHGEVAWDLKWCPDPTLAEDALVQETRHDGTLPRLGLLAAILGDGSLKVWAVPRPEYLPASDGSYVALPEPVVQLGMHHLGGSVASRVDWLPSPPHDLLLIGCWDGAIAIVQLRPDELTTRAPLESKSAGPSEGSEMVGARLLSYFPGECQAIRAVKWMPPCSAGVTIDNAHRHMFATSGHEGSVRVWDSRNQHAPALSHPLTVYTLNDLTWTTHPLALTLAGEDATMRSVLLESKQLIMQGNKAVVACLARGNNQGAIWAVQMHPSGRAYAYAGEDGVVGLASAEVHFDPRRRPSHVPISSLKWRNEALQVLFSEDLRHDNGGLFCNLYKSGSKTEAPASEPQTLAPAPQSLHRLAWSPLTSRRQLCGMAWVAYGGAAGIVRCQFVGADDALAGV